jgi:hypothetical protein
MLKANIYALVAGFFLIVMAPTALAGEEQRIHFFGNSYTSWNNNGLERFVQRLLEESLNFNTTVYTDSTTRNGADLTDHVGSAREKLLGGSNPRWDMVVIQDQSTIPAYIYSNSWYDSMDAGVALNNIIEETGAVTMFFQTWGRQRGLKNSDFFTNYTIMQDYLTFGYRKFQQAANSPRSFVAPVGLAYQLVWDSQGSDTGNRFRELYGGDESHPTIQGTFLSACVIYAAYTGRSVSELEWCNGIEAVRCEFLKRAADEAVFDDDTYSPARWEIEGFVFPPEETDVELTASPTPFVGKQTASPASTPGCTLGSLLGKSEDPLLLRLCESLSSSPAPSPSAAPSANSPSSPNANPGLSAAPAARDETSTAPRASGRMVISYTLLFAAIGFAISM